MTKCFFYKRQMLGQKMLPCIFYLTGLLDFLRRRNLCCRICEISLTSLPPPPWIIDLPAAQGGEFLWEFSTIGDISRHKSLFYRSQWYIFISSKDFHSAGKHFVDEERRLLPFKDLFLFPWIVCPCWFLRFLSLWLRFIWSPAYLCVGSGLGRGFGLDKFCLFQLKYTNTIQH